MGRVLQAESLCAKAGEVLVLLGGEAADTDGAEDATAPWTATSWGSPKSAMLRPSFLRRAA